MKSMRNTGRKMHGGDGFERRRVEQDEVTAIGGPVVHEAHGHAVVLRCGFIGRNEDELAWLAAGSESHRLRALRCDVVFEDRIGRSRGSVGITDRVTVPVAPADEALVDAWKL